MATAAQLLRNTRAKEIARARHGWGTYELYLVANRAEREKIMTEANAWAEEELAQRYAFDLQESINSL